MLLTDEPNWNHILLFFNPSYVGVLNHGGILVHNYYLFFLENRWLYSKVYLTKTIEKNQLCMGLFDRPTILEKKSIWPVGTTLSPIICAFSLDIRAFRGNVLQTKCSSVNTVQDKHLIFDSSYHCRRKLMLTPKFAHI